MTNEDEFDLFIIDSFLELYHIMESRMSAEEEYGKKGESSSEITKGIQSEGGDIK